MQIFGQAAEWGSRVMYPLILNFVTAAECGETSCFLSEVFKMSGPEDEKILSRQVGAEVLHGRWAMLVVFGGLAPWIFDAFVGLSFAESMWLKGVKPMANPGDAGRNPALHVHPSLAEMREAGNAILGQGGVTLTLKQNRQRKVKFKELERRTQHLHLRLPVGALPTGC